MRAQNKKQIHPGAAKLADLRAQRELIDQQIEQLQTEERASILESVRALIAQYGLTAPDRANSVSPRQLGLSLP